MSLKNPVTPPGIDPGTFRLVGQRLNHYATPGPSFFSKTLLYYPFVIVHGGRPVHRKHKEICDRRTVWTEASSTWLGTHGMPCLPVGPILRDGAPHPRPWWVVTVGPGTCQAFALSVIRLPPGTSQKIQKILVRKAPVGL